MRCLYCGKELALLKRLTGGAEFCSDAHRKKYQEEYNDLALSRLLQNQSISEPKSKAKPQDAQPVVSRKSVGAAVEQPVAVAPEPPKPEPKPEKSKAEPAKVAAPAPKPQAAPPQPKRQPQPPDEVRPMWGYIVEQPNSSAPSPADVVGFESFIDSFSAPALPAREIAAEASVGDRGLAWANPVRWTPGLRGTAEPPRARDRNPEVRDFVRGAATSIATPAHPNTPTTALSRTVGETMDITNQPRPPADPPVVWVAGPLTDFSIDALIGSWGSVPFTTTGFSGEQPQEDATVAPPRVQAPPPVPIAEPVALAPAPTPIVAATEPQPMAPAAPVEEPVPVNLLGIPAPKGKLLKVVSNGAPVVLEPKAPVLSALPLRPHIVLGPAPKAPAAEPAPVIARVPPSQPTAPASSKLRSTGKAKRADVRVIQTPVPAPIPAKEPAPVVAPPETAKPSIAAAVPKNEQESPKPSIAAPVPEPTASVKHIGPSSLLVPADPVPETQKSAVADVDLRLPELHVVEVSPGALSRLPGAAKGAIAAVLAMGIIGLAYNAFNSNTASATVAPSSKASTYTVGKQINTSGWIDDWAPNDALRRVTLLRNSQPFSDYRMQFSAQIQKKSIGWMYRGLNPKNFYVAKIEKIKSGLDPEVALVRYAVIDGKNEQRVETKLPIKARVDTLYKVRFDAVGPSFTVWVQGEKVAEWRDTRIGSGGLGLYSEGDEAAVIHGSVDVFELIPAR